MNVLKLKKDNIRVGLGFAALSLIGAVGMALLGVNFEFTPQALLTYYMSAAAGLCAYSLVIHLTVTDKV